MKASELMESFVESSKTAMEPAQELSEITKRAFEKTAEQNMAVMKEYMEFGLRGMKMLSAVRDPRVLVEKQMELTTEAGEKFVANAEAYVKLATETQAELASWTEKTTEAAVAKAEEATDVAVAKAEKVLKQVA